jgi:hypothetical protein
MLKVEDDMSNRKDLQEHHGPEQSRPLDTAQAGCGAPEGLSFCHVSGEVPAFQCYDDVREVYSQIYDRRGNALTYGDIVDWLNEWAETSSQSWL